uniref:Solute carrier family 15 member 1 n=1 Tax=Junco hyemalis TaxID=40217 RepID=A0A8C5J8R7_JUNHY
FAPGVVFFPPVLVSTQEPFFDLFPSPFVLTYLIKCISSLDNRTILYLSIVYAIGQTVLSVGSINDLTDHNQDGSPDAIAVNIALSMVGLILIAFGTGGIKPCVSAFGGDQFEDDQEKQRSTFFSLFYLSINAGSLLSTLITPTIRGKVTLSTAVGRTTKQEVTDPSQAWATLSTRRRGTNLSCHSRRTVRRTH